MEVGREQKGSNKQKQTASESEGATFLSEPKLKAVGVSVDYVPTFRSTENTKMALIRKSLNGSGLGEKSPRSSVSS